jgi:hypothetical protein
MRALPVVAAIVAMMSVAASSTLHHAFHRDGGVDLALRRVVFAHRHGARTPIINMNGSCDAIGCGELTIQGANMLHSMGAQFRARYGEILPDYNDPRSIVVQSDTVTRVIQSASAFLDGLFAYNASYTPLPATVNDGTSSLIDPWSQPGFGLHQVPYALGAYKNLTDAMVAIVPVSAIAAIGAEMDLPELACDIRSLQHRVQQRRSGVPRLLEVVVFEHLDIIRALVHLEEVQLGSAQRVEPLRSQWETVQ